MSGRAAGARAPVLRVDRAIIERRAGLHTRPTPLVVRVAGGAGAAVARGPVALPND